MWEYKLNVIRGSHIKNIEDQFNELGTEGWEIINYGERKPAKFGDEWEFTVIMKRQKLNSD